MHFLFRVKMAFALLVLGTSISQGSLTVSVRYNIPHQKISKVLEKLIECQKRELIEYACVARPFEDENKAVAMIGCGPNLPGKDGKGCTLSFFDGRPRKSGHFSLGMRKNLSVSGTMDGLEKIRKQLKAAGNGHQHLNFGNPFFEKAEKVNYVCERKNEKEAWTCYLDVTDSVR